MAEPTIPVHVTHHFGEEITRLREENARLREALVAARTELARWGWGDFHYGSSGQERSVVDALAAIDRALDGEKEGSDARPEC